MSIPKWTTANIPDMSGKTVLVTGGNSGLGLETVRQLSNKRAEVIMACRSEEKGKTAVATIKAENPEANVTLMLLDLANLESIRKFTEEFKNNHNKLDILINNAGVMALPKRHETADGFEMQFGTNHLGHFALTGLLLDLLLKTEDSRIVNISSMAHRGGRVDFNNLNAERSYTPWGAYGLSKISNLFFTYELQRKLEKAGKKTIAVAAHPGYTNTNLQQHSGFFRNLNPLMAQDVSIGTLPQLMAATESNLMGGEFFGPRGFMEWAGYPKVVESNKLSYDLGIAARLWEESEKLTGVKYDL